MEAKLLKKMRSRYTMYCDPNKRKLQYVIELNQSKWYAQKPTIYGFFETKEEMFKAYRESIIEFSGEIYGCYKQKRELPKIYVTHNV